MSQTRVADIVILAKDQALKRFQPCQVGKSRARNRGERESDLLERGQNLQQTLGELTTDPDMIAIPR